MSALSGGQLPCPGTGGAVSLLPQGEALELLSLVSAVSIFLAACDISELLFQAPLPVTTEVTVCQETDPG